MRVLLLHGPNLNLLGSREPDLYGHITLGELEERCRSWAAELGVALDVFQSNHEGGLIDRLHEAIGVYDGAILNAGALTHYSYSLLDAVRAVAIPTVEVHLTDITAREPWRAHSVLTEACIATIVGKGPDGYREALELLAGR